MRSGDAEFMQILNIIQRGQRLVVHARKDGANTSLAEEYLTESKYALKVNKRETAVEYAKKAIFEVVKAKRAQTKESITSSQDLEKLTKIELRNLCAQYELDPIGVKLELVTRVWEHLQSMPDSEDEDISDAEEVGVEEEIISEAEELHPGSVEERKPGNKEWNPEEAISHLTTGLSYLIEEKRPDKLFRIYNSLIISGRPGLAISRTNPKLLAKRYGLDEIASVWLTGKEIHGDMKTVLPILEFIMSFIEEFMDEHNDGVILVDGLEYLLTNNKFNSVLRFVRQLVDNVSQTDCLLMVALSPDALEQTEVTLLEKDLLPIDYQE